MYLARYFLIPVLIIVVTCSTISVKAQSLTIEIPEAELNKTTIEGQEGEAEIVVPGGVKLTDRMAEQIKTLIRLALQTGDSTAFETALFDLTSASPELAVAIAAFTTSEVTAQIAARTEQANENSTETSSEVNEDDVADDEEGQAGTEVTEDLAGDTEIDPENALGNTAAASISFKPVSTDLMKSLTVAATIGPAKASPAKFREIMAATSKIIAPKTSANAAPNTNTSTAESAIAEAELDSNEISIEEELQNIIQQQVQEIVVNFFEIENVTSETNLEDIVNLLPAAGIVEQPSSESASPTG